MNDTIILRTPTTADAAAMVQIARSTEVLSVNSTYSYALMASFFSATCCIAEINSKRCGYVTAFFPPQQPDTLFVWQVGVSPKAQGKGIAKKMLTHLVQQCKPRYLDASITRDNRPSRKLFLAVATHFAAKSSFADTAIFDTTALGAKEAPEYVMHIGPFPTST